MIAVVKIVLFIIAFFILALLLGGLFVVPLSEKKQSNSLMIITGTLLMFAVFGVMAIPMIMTKQPFHNLVFMWMACMALLAIVSLVLNGKKLLRTIRKIKINRNGFFWAAVGIILIQIFIVLFFACPDVKLMDQAAVAGEAYSDDTMFMKEPATGNEIIDFGSAWQKQVLSPVALFWALFAKIIHVHPSILIFSVLPFIIIPITYLGYWMLGELLFKSKPEKSCLFFFVVALFHTFAYPSDYTQNFSLLSGYFRGEAVFCNLMFPVVFYLLFSYMLDKDKKSLGMILLTLLASVTVWWPGAILELIAIVIFFVINRCGDNILLYSRKVFQIFIKNKDGGKEEKENKYLEYKGEKSDMKIWKLVLALFFVFAILTAAAVYKVNSKINSVFEITQETKSQIDALKTEVDAKTGQTGDLQKNAVSGGSSDTSSNTDFSTVSGGEARYRDITRFTEADGTTYITYDTGSESEYRIYQPDMNEDAGGMGYIIELPGGELVVVDGGYFGDGARLHDFLMEHGGVVSAWYLTHPHYDHIGAFLYCMADENKGDLKVNKVYYSPFTEEFFSQENSKLDMQVEGEALKFEEFNQLMKSSDSDIFIPLSIGDKVENQSLKVECLWSFDENVTDINNNSLVLKMDMNGTSVLFTGDIMEDALDRMIRTFGEDSSKWKSDIVQIPHHGYEGMSGKLYQLTKPAFALLDCSTTEYNENILGIRDNTVESIHGMGIGVVKRFEGTNIIVLK